MLEETGERQVKPFIKDIDLAHRERYSFASELICEGYNVADVGCGIGYGSYIMAITTPCNSICAIEISEEAISYAKEQYFHHKVEYKICNILEEPIENFFNLITAFEVVEHIDKPFEFLCALNNMLENDGIIILTTPNESVLPYSKEDFAFHVRHYYPDELLKLVEKADLEVVFRGSQNGRGIYAFEGNAFNVFICKKRGSCAEVFIKNVIKDTPFHRAMADYERMDWLLSNAPQPDYYAICREIARTKLEDKSIYDYVIQRIDYHRRTYMPQTLNDNPDFEGALGEIGEGINLKQSFVAGMDYLCGISVLPGIFGTVFKGLVCFSLYDVKQTLLGFQSFVHVNDNQLLNFEFLPINESRGKEFTLEIYTCKLEEEAKLTFYTTCKKDGCVLRINGEETSSTLTFRTIYI